jgi:hypothetical protein
MTDTITSAVARARRLGWQRAAGCCTALIEHRRFIAAAPVRSRKLSLRRGRHAEPIACCA